VPRAVHTYACTRAYIHAHTSGKVAALSGKVRRDGGAFSCRMHGNRAAARKVEQETCRESRSRKLNFRKARLLHRSFSSLSFSLSLSLLANRLVRNSREDGLQFSERLRLIRFPIISATSFRIVALLARGYACRSPA